MILCYLVPTKMYIKPNTATCLTVRHPAHLLASLPLTSLRVCYLCALKISLAVIRNVILNNTRSISYIPSSTTTGYVYQHITLAYCWKLTWPTSQNHIPSSYLSLEPYVPRYSKSSPGEIYGDTELYQYDTTQNYNISTYPLSRFVNEVGPGFDKMKDIK